MHCAICTTFKASIRKLYFLSLLVFGLMAPDLARGASLSPPECCGPIYGDPFRSFDRLGSFSWFGRIDLKEGFSPSQPFSFALSNPDSGEVYFSATLLAHALVKNGEGWLFADRRGSGPFLWVALFPHNGKWQVRVEGAGGGMAGLAAQPGKETMLVVKLEVEGECYSQGLALVKTKGPPGWKD